MENPFQKLYANPKPWIDFEHGLQLARQKLRATEWVPSVSPPTAKMIGENERALMRGQLLLPLQECFPRFAAAIEHFFAKGEWPKEMPEPVVYYLHLAFLFSIRWVRGTVAGDAKQSWSIVPFPSGPSSLVAMWMLTEWWRMVGSRQYAEEATTDQAIFQKFFA